MRKLLPTLILSILFLPSCIRYHKVFNTEFPQGDEKTRDQDLIVKNLRTVNVYDQFTTKGIFDVLWLSDKSREYYVDVYSRKHGLNKEETNAMLRRQLEDNKHYVSFYMLAYIPENGSQTLGDSDSPWSAYLLLPNGKKVSTSSVKEVELSSEYKHFFGRRYTQFKIPYLIKFRAQDLALLDGKHSTFELVFSSVDRDIHMRWFDKPSSGVKILKKNAVRTSEGKVAENEDFYWL